MAALRFSGFNMEHVCVCICLMFVCIVDVFNFDRFRCVRLDHGKSVGCGYVGERWPLWRFNRKIMFEYLNTFCRKIENRENFRISFCWIFSQTKIPFFHRTSMVFISWKLIFFSFLSLTLMFSIMKKSSTTFKWQNLSVRTKEKKNGRGIS